MVYTLMREPLSVQTSLMIQSTGHNALYDVANLNMLSVRLFGPHVALHTHV